MTLTLFASSLGSSSGAITACFNDVVLSQLRFEHSKSRFRGERSNRLRKSLRLIV